MLPSGLLSGLLATAAHPMPVRLRVLLCNLGARFLAKGRVGKGYRYIARNGRVLLATDSALADLTGRLVEMRMQIWHRATLSGDLPEPFGLLLCFRSKTVCSSLDLCRASLVANPDGRCELALDVGGRLWLEFRRIHSPFVSMV